LRARSFAVLEGGVSTAFFAAMFQFGGLCTTQNISFSRVNPVNASLIACGLVKILIQQAGGLLA
jgi:hypothetical protein